MMVFNFLKCQLLELFRLKLRVMFALIILKCRLNKQTKFYHKMLYKKITKQLRPKNCVHLRLRWYCNINLYYTLFQIIRVPINNFYSMLRKRTQYLGYFQ